MTSEPSRNRVVIIGLLDPMRDRNKAVAVAERRTPLGGRAGQFSLQLDTPYGEPFRITVSTGVQTEGAELLTQERIGRPVVIEGCLQTRIVTDPRYAVEDTDAGRTTREMYVRATRIREPQLDEPVGTSAVWLDGAVMAAPRFGQHRAAAAVELARTVLRVRWSRLSQFGAGVIEEADINLATPVTMEHAGYTLVAGNQLSVLGQLDCVLIPVRGPLVDARLAQLGQEWHEQKRSAETADALRQGLRAFRRQRERLSTAPVLTVVPVQVTPQAGAAPGDLEAARAADRARIESRPRRRTLPAQSGVERTASRLAEALTPPQASEPAAEPEPVDVPPDLATPAAEAPVETAPPAAVRPRRKPAEASVAANGAGWAGEESE